MTISLAAVNNFLLEKTLILSGVKSVNKLRWNIDKIINAPDHIYSPIEMESDSKHFHLISFSIIIHGWHAPRVTVYRVFCRICFTICFPAQFLWLFSWHFVVCDFASTPWSKVTVLILDIKRWKGFEHESSSGFFMLGIFFCIAHLRLL